MDTAVAARAMVTVDEDAAMVAEEVVVRAAATLAATVATAAHDVVGSRRDASLRPCPPEQRMSTRTVDTDGGTR